MQTLTRGVPFLAKRFRDASSPKEVVCVAISAKTCDPTLTTLGSLLETNAWIQNIYTPIANILTFPAIWIALFTIETKRLGFSCFRRVFQFFLKTWNQIFKKFSFNVHDTWILAILLYLYDLGAAQIRKTSVQWLHRGLELILILHMSRYFKFK